MRLSVFLVLLPSVTAFVTPTGSAVLKKRGFSGGPSSPRMMASRQEHAGGGNEEAWSIASWWSDVVGSAAKTRGKANSAAADEYASLRQKVLVKKERQSLEGQLSSLIRIEGKTMSCKAEGHVRRIASELEALQDNAASFGAQKTGLAGSWKLIFSSANCEGSKSKGSSSKDGGLTSIEDIFYVSENYRLSHTGEDELRVYKRVTAPSPRAAAASDDTSAAMVGAGAAASAVAMGGKKAARAAAAGAAGRGGMAKQPLRRRMFFGFLRR